MDKSEQILEMMAKFATVMQELDGALKIENEKELLLIRLTILENEISLIKARLEEIA